MQNKSRSAFKLSGLLNKYLLLLIQLSIKLLSDF